MFNNSLFLSIILVLLVSVKINNALQDFSVSDEPEYLNAFSTLIKYSYSAPLPADLIANCKNKNSAGVVTTRTVTTSMSSSDLQVFCGTNTICTIAQGVTVTMNSNLNVAALVVSGTLIWNDNSQNANDQWLCAGYIAVCKLAF